jgi:hypothetical protein
VSALSVANACAEAREEAQQATGQQTAGKKGPNYAHWHHTTAKPVRHESAAYVGFMTPPAVLVTLCGSQP